MKEIILDVKKFVIPSKVLVDSKNKIAEQAFCLVEKEIKKFPDIV